MAVKPIPDGYHTVTPYLIVSDVAGLIDFLQLEFPVSGAHPSTLLGACTERSEVTGSRKDARNAKLILCAFAPLRELFLQEPFLEIAPGGFTGYVFAADDIAATCETLEERGVRLTAPPQSPTCLLQWNICTIRTTLSLPTQEPIICEICGLFPKEFPRSGAHHDE